VTFTSVDFLVFAGFGFYVYWLMPSRAARVALLLAGSYVFYGYVHPWFCILLATSRL